MKIDNATEEASITWGFEHMRLQQILTPGERREDDWLFNGERPQKVKRENEAEELV